MKMAENNPIPEGRPKRRVRYAGKYPRYFHEKYKELDPLQYPDTVQKVVASGKTPAGSHRPICVPEILEILSPQPGETAVDVTLGYGGHAMEIIPRLLPGGLLFGLDADSTEIAKTQARLIAAGFPSDHLICCHTNFAALPQVLAAHGRSGADLILADLGCSSMQLDDPQRGFSYKNNGPLDLRFNPQKGQSASAFLATLDQDSLTNLLWQNADVPHAQSLAEAIIQAQTQSPITTTQALSRAIRNGLTRLPKAVREKDGDTALRRVFQALRVAVNHEYSVLETFLRVLPSCLNSGGRVAILTFHSGEDRRVKQAFQSGLNDGAYARIAREVIRPTPEEIRSNPRSTSAKLRWTIRSSK